MCGLIGLESQVERSLAKLSLKNKVWARSVSNDTDSVSAPDISVDQGVPLRKELPGPFESRIYSGELVH